MNELSNEVMEGVKDVVKYKQDAKQAKADLEKEVKGRER